MKDETMDTEEKKGNASLERIDANDEYKEQTQDQWNNDPCGSHYVEDAKEHTLEWYLQVERYRYDEYGPWMPEDMEFSRHSGKKLLEIGAGIGTDLSQFAKNGAEVTDIDLSAGHLALAKENFELRGLDGTFVHHDAETLPFDDNTFDVVYSNGVIHHTPNTSKVVREIYRVLKPGGKVIIMVYAEHSLHYWARLVYALGLRKNMLEEWSIGEIMSRHVELSETGAKPLVKVYTKKRIEKMFSTFKNISVIKRQLIRAELPPYTSWLPLPLLGRIMGWNLILKAEKP